MQQEQFPRATGASSSVLSKLRLPGALTLGTALFIGVFSTGCSVSPIAKHATALSAVVAPVVDQSTAAYREAVALDDLRWDYEAVVAYEKKDASYNPRNTPELLSEKDLQTRLAVLAALQVYSTSLVEITKSTDSSELEAASKPLGSNLTALGNNLAPSIESVLGINAAANTTTETIVTTVSGSTTTTNSTTTSKPAPLLSPEARNGISTGIDALGQFLVGRTIEKELPGKIEEMDPHVLALCKALSDDIQTLQSIEERDYDRILNLEKQFILDDEQPGKNVNPQEHRAEIMKLPEIARQQRESNEKLTSLREALNKLALTHHALAAEAQHNNPETLKEKLADLAAAGSSLGNFYSSLPTK
ncbi:MAG: hypothetical protein ABSE87_01945 [Terracidiphilus sp.]|jgi:hypothetical protein